MINREISDRSIAELDAKLAKVEEQVEVQIEQFQALATNARYLADKARRLVELMDDVETNHGGLIGGVTLRAKNELRLELSKWSKSK